MKLSEQRTFIVDTTRKNETEKTEPRERRISSSYIFYDDGDIYFGDVTENLRDGTGVMDFADGERYEGEWVAGKRNGHGVIFDGGKTIGTWKDDKLGGMALSLYGDGSFYEGEMKDGVRHGDGCCFFTDGRTLKVVYDDGKLTHADKIEYETVEFFGVRVKKKVVDKNDKNAETGAIKAAEKALDALFCNPFGNVSMTRKRVDEICDEKAFEFFENDEKEYVEFKDGDRYRGETKDGVPHGKGRYYSELGWVYEGEFFDGQINGKGKAVFSDGTVYFGEWKDGKRDGVGRSVFANGAQYVGGYVSDRFDGDGVYVYKNGNFYNGSFKRGKPSGRGVFGRLTNGEKIYRCTSGEWQSGKRIGRQKRFLVSTTNGNVYFDSDRYYLDGEEYVPQDFFPVSDRRGEYLAARAEKTGTIFSEWRSIGLFELSDDFERTGSDEFCGATDTERFCVGDGVLYKKVIKKSDEPNAESWLWLRSESCGKETATGVRLLLQERYVYTDFSLNPKKKLSKTRSYFHLGDYFCKIENFSIDGAPIGKAYFFVAETVRDASIWECPSMPNTEWKLKKTNRFEVLNAATFGADLTIDADGCR